MKREEVLNTVMTFWNFTAGEWLVTDAVVDFFHIEFQKFIVEEILNPDF
jgi:hypothetical protein